MTTREKLNKAIGGLEWVANSLELGDCDCACDQDGWEGHSDYCCIYLRGYIAEKLEELRAEK